MPSAEARAGTLPEGQVQAMFDRIADVEVYLDAVRRPLKYDERLYAGRGSTPVNYAQQTLATGIERANQLAKGDTPWMTQSGVRGFYSRIDGSAQPYLLTMPDNYDPAAKRQYRLDIFMHGRDDTVLEQQFMAKSLTGYTSKPFAAGSDRFMLQPYGRYTNASRFAGETDGFEAIDSVKNVYAIDPNRVVMAGFSMGGASAWSYIVHFADRWVAGAAGAGFTETEVFLRGGLARQPQNDVQRTLWHMYDSTDYAINTFNVPVLAYSGEIDAQKQAADAMAAAMLDEFAQCAHDIRVVGQGLDDGRFDGSPQTEPFGDEATGENQQPGRSHFAQRRSIEVTDGIAQLDQRLRCLDVDP